MLNRLKLIKSILLNKKYIYLIMKQSGKKSLALFPKNGINPDFSLKKKNQREVKYELEKKLLELLRPNRAENVYGLSFPKFQFLFYCV